MSNLLILYPDIPARATRIQTINNYEEARDVRNLITGPRSQRASLQTAAAHELIEFDLGSETDAPDSFYLGRGEELLNDPTGYDNELRGINVQGSTHSAFYPAEVSGLAAWYDANRGVTVDGSNNVEQWNDLSGNARHLTQATASRKPVRVNYENASNDRANDYIDFAGGDDGLQATGFTLTKPVTMFLALKFDDTSDAWACGTGTGVGAASLYTVSGTAYIHGGIGVSTTYSIDSTSWHVYTIVFNSTSSKFYVDGTQYGGTLNSGTATFPGFTVGNLYNYPDGSNAKYGEVLLYEGVLSDDDREAIEGYLVSKWGDDSTDEELSPVGPDDQDFATTFTAGTATRYHWVKFWANTTTYIRASKLFLGTAFNPSVDCDYRTIQRPRTSVAWIADSGGRFSTRLARPTYSVEATWQGLSEAEVETFFDNIGNKSNRDRYVLYTTANHVILNSVRALYCKLDAFSVRPTQKPDYYVLETKWSEEVG